MEKATKTDGRRSFEVRRDDSVTTYYLAMPSAEDIKKSDWHYSKIYNKALLDGMCTEQEILDALRQRDIYGDRYHERAAEMSEAIGEKIVAMETAEDLTVRKQLALEVAELRNNLFQWNQKINGPLSNSCERIAEDAKTEFLTSVVVQKENGSRVWSDYEAFLREPDQRLTVQARLEVMLWFQGLDSNFLDNVPENAVLREIAVAERAPKLTSSEEVTEVIGEPVESEKVERKRRQRKSAP